MRFRRGQLIRAILLVALPIGAPVLISDSRSQKANLPHQSPGMAAMHEEVRLRKLHLVRPDLIPYPIEYEYYC
jgi:hypothetical protein